MTLEEFIMQNITWIDLTIAGITLLTVIVSMFILVRSDKATRDVLFEKHNVRSAEHTTLSNEQKHLSQEHQGLAQQQSEIRQTVSFLKDNVLLEQGKRDNLSQQVLDIKRTSEHIAALVDLVHNTQLENKELKQEISQLRQQLKYYEQQNNEEMEL